MTSRPTSYEQVAPTATSYDVPANVIRTGRHGRHGRRPYDPDATGWLSAGELDEVTWAEPDVPFLAAIRDLVGAG